LQRESTVGVPLLLELRKNKRLTHQQADRIDTKISRKIAKIVKPRGLPMAVEDARDWTNITPNSCRPSAASSRESLVAHGVTCEPKRWRFCASSSRRCWHCDVYNMACSRDSEELERRIVAAGYHVTLSGCVDCNTAAAALEFSRARCRHETRRTGPNMSASTAEFGIGRSPRRFLNTPSG